MAATPEESKYTSAYDRIDGLKGREQVSAAGELPPVTAYEESLAWEIAQEEKAGDEKSLWVSRAKLAQAQKKKAEQAKRIARDGWLSPLELKERGPLGLQASRSGIRASDKGFLSLNLKDYLKLLDWTGRQGRSDNRGKIPAALASILERIGIDSSMWCDLVWSYKRYFGRSRATGRPENMQQDAAKHGHRWVHGQRSAAACFCT